MPDIDKSEFVEITHFINPHALWLRKCNIDDRDFDTIESELQQYAQRQYSELSQHQYDKLPSKIERSDRVAVYFVAWKKWLRCDVDVIDAQGAQCILWAIDYGFPFQSATSLIVSIENIKLAQRCSNLITKAAIATIIPWKESTDGKLRSGRERWAPAAIDVLTKIKKEYVDFEFKLQSVQSGETSLGELFVFAKNGQMKMVSQILIEMQLAKPVTDMNELLKSFERTAKMDRWISNTNEIHSDCILNQGTIEILGACRPEIVEMNTCYESSAPAVPNCTRDGVPKRPLCSSEKVVRYFETKRRNARIARKQAEVLENEWVSQQEKLNKSIESRVETKSKKQNAVSAALPYTSLAKEKNTYIKSQNPTPLPATPTWPVNGVNDQKQQNGTVANGMPRHEKAQPIRCSATKTPIIGEVKIQTNNDMTRILVHSKNLRIKPINAICQAPFTPEIHALIKNRYTETFKSQAYAWPHLMRGNSLILVDSKNRGKTVAYLLALCSRLQMNLDESSGMYNQSQLAMGPKAIILCANASAVENTAYLCRWLMNRIKTEVVHAIGSRNIQDVAAKLFNGCSIFVTTTPCLLNLMKSHSDVFSAQKLSFVVFDNIDMIISRCEKDQLATIFNKFCKQSNDGVDMTTQVVVTARTWHPILKNMHKRLLNPLLLIGNFLEAALYGKMNIQVQFNLEAEKLNFVYQHIQSLPSNTERLLIVCNDEDEANELKAFLEAKEVELKCVVSINPNIKNLMTHNIQQYWQSLAGVLICTDETLKELRILNAQHIIHFSMPDSFNNFLFRFSSSIECYPNEIAESEETKSRTSSLFCVDKKNKKQVPKLINLMERRGEIFSENVIEYCQNIRIENDEEKAKECRLESICNFLFMHGRSNHESYCRERHLLMPEDVPQSTCAVPQSGSVRLKILNIVSPTRYSVQLLTTQQNVNHSWKPVNQADAYMDFNTKFNLYYSEPNNHRDLLSIELDMLCAIENNNGPTHAYHRGRIIKICEKKSRCASDFDVDVRLIDVGTIVRRKSTELRRLADEFHHFPEQAIDLHLIGLVPADKEDEWDSEITRTLESYLDKITLDQENIHVEANIVFSLRKAIVVDCLRITQIIGCDCIILCSVKKHMKQKKMGISAMEFRRNIIKMAESIGIKFKCQNDHQAQEERNSNDDLPETNGNASVKNCGAPRESNVATSPSQAADKKSVNLMEFSPVASQTSSRQNLTIDTSMGRILTTTDAPNENWTTVPDSASVRCEVTAYRSPDSFFINKVDEEHNQMLGDIDRYVEQYDGIDTSMEMPDIGNFCLAKIDGKYNRAKILSNSCKNGIFYARVFCCDIGSIVDCEIENVMSIPDSFRTLPFQAIWCRLYGIRPIESLNSGWLEKISYQIFDEVIDPIQNLFVKMISVHEMTPLEPSSPFTMQKLNVILMSSDFKVNRLVVSRGLAEFEIDADHVIDSCPSTTESSGIDSDDDDDEDEDEGDDEEDWDQEWEDAGIVRQPPAQQTLNDDIAQQLLKALTDGSMEVCFNEDDCVQIIEPNLNLYKAIEAEPKDLDKHEEKKKKEEPKISRSNPTSDSGNCGEVTFNQQVIGKLQYKYKVPYVTWQQSDELIVLTIKADENVVYNLDVTSDRLIFNAVIRDETNLLVLHFFGSIDPEYTSHEIRGLNVIVRLVKIVPDWLWPHLTSEHKKFNWLSYDYSAINSDDPYIYNNPGKYMKPAVEATNSDDNESDSDDNGMICNDE